MDNLIGIREAALILGVSTKTLRNWDNEGTFVSIKTRGGHRRYLLSQIKLFFMSKEIPMNYVPVDESVEDLLEDIEEKTDSPVIQTMKKVMDIIGESDLDYGSRVRVLTKVLMIVNERHRIAVFN